VITMLCKNGVVMNTIDCWGCGFIPVCLIERKPPLDPDEEQQLKKSAPRGGIVDKMTASKKESARETPGGVPGNCNIIPWLSTIKCADVRKFRGLKICQDCRYK